MEIPTDIAEAIGELLSLESGQDGRKIPVDGWQALQPGIGALFPGWYRELMAQYPLAGREFDVDEEGFYQGEIHFWEPAFSEHLADAGELSSFYGAGLSFPESGFPFCHLPDGEMIVATGENPETAVVVYFNGIRLEERSPLNGGLAEFFSRLIPSDFDG